MLYNTFIMKKALTLALSLFCTAALLSSCEQCGTPVITEPTAADSAWLVYAKEDSAIFEDKAGNRIKYTATDSISQTVLGADVDPGSNCFDKLDTNSIVILKDKAKVFPALATFIYKTPTKLEVRLAVESSEEKVLTIDSPTYASKVINGVTYENVYEVTMQKLKDYSAKQVLFNKEYGFLYIELHNGKTLTRKL